ncbi:MAG: hypothetical protein ABS911_14395 [Carnobacterium sp.]
MGKSAHSYLAISALFSLAVTFKRCGSEMGKREEVKVFLTAEKNTYEG